MCHSFSAIRCSARSAFPKLLTFYIFTTESLQQTPKATHHTRRVTNSEEYSASSKPLSRIHREPPVPPTPNLQGMERSRPPLALPPRTVMLASCCAMTCDRMREQKTRSLGLRICVARILTGSGRRRFVSRIL